MGTKKGLNKKVARKIVRQSIYQKLSGALQDFKAGMKEKKFENLLRKTSRLLTDEILKAEGKKKTVSNAVSITKAPPVPVEETGEAE